MVPDLCGAITITLTTYDATVVTYDGSTSIAVAATDFTKIETTSEIEFALTLTDYAGQTGAITSAYKLYVDLLDCIFEDDLVAPLLANGEFDLDTREPVFIDFSPFYSSSGSACSLTTSYTYNLALDVDSDLEVDEYVAFTSDFSQIEIKAPDDGTA